jgi:hypothetical protein
MVKNLIAGTMSAAGDGFGRSEVGRIEVAHSPGKNFPLALKLFECRNRVRQWVVAAPM